MTGVRESVELMRSQGPKHDEPLADILDKLRADQAPGSIEQICRSQEARCLKLKGQLNKAIARRKAKVEHLKKVRAQLGLLDKETLDESEVASRLAEPSSSFIGGAMDSELDLDMSFGASKMDLQPSTLGGASAISATNVSYETQKARIQNSIEMQLFKAMEEERLGKSYKQIHRRLKDELTILKKSADDIKTAVEDYQDAMEQERLRLRSANQSRREAVNLWKEVNRVKEESAKLWQHKMSARERVAEKVIKERTELENRAMEREKARRRAQIQQKRTQTGKHSQAAHAEQAQRGAAAESEGALEPGDPVAELAAQGDKLDPKVKASVEVYEKMQHLMRGMKVADEGPDSLYNKMTDMQDKGATAKEQAAALEATLNDRNEVLRGLTKERDALRLEAAGGDVKGLEELKQREDEVAQASASAARVQRQMSRLEATLAQVLLGIRLLGGRVDQVLPEVMRDYVDQKDFKPDLGTVDENSDRPGSKGVDGDDTRLAEEVSTAWKRLQERIEMVIAAEWPKAKPSDLPAEINADLAKSASRQRLMSGASRQHLESEPSEAQSGKGSPLPGKEASKASLTRGEEERKSLRVMRANRSMSSASLKKRLGIPGQHPSDPNNKVILRTRSKLRSVQQEGMKHNIRIKLEGESDESSEEEHEHTEVNPLASLLHHRRHNKDDDVLDRQTLKAKSKALAEKHAPKHKDSSAA
ncbi:unnamed protein product [Pedinophyceae sp. YPF-701]|nr:unnamed protein product [Pedinophyceae sp. YPF-701]